MLTNSDFIQKIDSSAVNLQALLRVEPVSTDYWPIFASHVCLGEHNCGTECQNFKNTDLQANGTL